MIYAIIIGLVIAYFSLSYLFKPAAKPATTDVAPAPKAVILSPDAQVFLQKYAFQRSYMNDNAITICISIDFFSLDGGCSDMWISKLKTMCEVSKVFLLVRFESEDAEACFRARLADRSTMGALVPPHRVLFYSGEIGKIAIVRQLQPGVHFEDDVALCPKLSPHVPTLVLLRGGSSNGDIGAQVESGAKKWEELDKLANFSLS